MGTQVCSSACNDPSQSRPGEQGKYDRDPVYRQVDGVVRNKRSPSNSSDEERVVVAHAPARAARDNYSAWSSTGSQRITDITSPPVGIVDTIVSRGNEPTHSRRITISPGGTRREEQVPFSHHQYLDKQDHNSPRVHTRVYRENHDIQTHHEPRANPHHHHNSQRVTRDIGQHHHHHQSPGAARITGEHHHHQPTGHHPEHITQPIHTQQMYPVHRDQTVHTQPEHAQPVHNYESSHEPTYTDYQSVQSRRESHRPLH